VKIFPKSVTMKKTEVKSQYFASVHKLPLSRFIDCLIDGDLSSLIIEGKPSEEELAQAWETILDEYQELLGSGDAEFKQFLSTCKELTGLQSKYNKIALLLNVLENVGLVEEFATQVRRLINKNLKFDIKQGEQYKRDIKYCQGVLRSLHLQISIKEKAVEAIQKSNPKKGRAMTRLDFQTILVNLSDFSGYLLTDQITVADYCTRINRYNQYIQSNPKKAK